MAIRFIMDSGADFSFAQASRLGIDMIPIGVSVEGKSYLDGVDIELSFLAKQMKEGKDVKTSQCTYQQFYDVFMKYAQSGDEVIYFSFSGGISGNYQLAVMVSRDILEEYPEYKLQVVDTKLVLCPLHAFILDVIKLRDRGAGVKMILDYLEAYREKVMIFASTDDLYYLVKGGRISNAKAVIGNMLNVKPVLAMVDGKLINVGKVRGLKMFYKFFLQELKKTVPKKNISDRPVVISHFMNYEGVSIVQNLLEKQFGVDKFIVNNMSSAVGAHLGPSGIAISYSPVDVDLWD